MLSFPSISYSISVVENRKEIIVYCNKKSNSLIEQLSYIAPNGWSIICNT